MPSMDTSCQRLVAELKRQDRSIVFAESCTAGLIAATLARIPGASEILAGSLVVYQVDSKIQWLEITSEALQENDVVSSAVSMQMAQMALRKTPHAEFAASVTGHLGPNAPVELDGIAYCGFARRENEQILTEARCLKLDVGPKTSDPIQLRLVRQAEAVHQVCEAVYEQISQSA